MGLKTKIEWCDATINFFWGCEKVSPACTHCYAEGFAKRVGDDIWGKDKPRRWIKSAVSDAKKLNAKAAKEGVKYRVFMNSMADFFEEDHGQPIVDHNGEPVYWCAQCDCECSSCQGDDEFDNDHEWHQLTLSDLRSRAFEIIDQTPDLIWMILTKRPENIRKMLVRHCLEKVPSHVSQNAGDGYQINALQNLWLGTTVENQEWADKRIPELLKCRDLADKLFLSCEPLLGSVDLTALPSVSGIGRGLDSLRTVGAEFSDLPGRLDWVICGGESGHHARPMHPDWARSLRDQCQAANVPFFFKQWGEWVPWEIARTYEKNDDCAYGGFHDSIFIDSCMCEECMGNTMYRVGKKNAGRLLDGKEHNELPET